MATLIDRTTAGKLSSDLREASRRLDLAIEFAKDEFSLEEFKEFRGRAGALMADVYFLFLEKIWSEYPPLEADIPDLDGLSKISAGENTYFQRIGDCFRRSQEFELSDVELDHLKAFEKRVPRLERLFRSFSAG